MCSGFWRLWRGGRYGKTDPEVFPDFSALGGDHARCSHEFSGAFSGYGSEEVETTQGEPAKILIVDDEPKICQLLSRYLTLDGYQCASADSGEAALKMLESDSFDLALPGIVATVMSGLDDLA